MYTGRVWFINRQPVLAPEPGVRKLIARDAGGRLLGFIFFDAVYDGSTDAPVGYYANVTRMLPDAHTGTLNLIIKHFLDRCVRSSEQHVQVRLAVHAHGVCAQIASCCTCHAANPITLQGAG